jgi:hypothetical protein
MAIGTSLYGLDFVDNNGYLFINSSEYYYYCSYETIDGVLYIRYTNKNGNTYIHTLVKFPQNKSLTTYTVPDKVRTIARGAFQGNKYIQTIRIPSTIQYIGDNAFDGCENLKTIEVYSSDSAIQAVEMDEDIEKKEIGRYNINGVKVEEKDGGIQIILYSDGSAEKVLEQP